MQSKYQDDQRNHGNHGQSRAITGNQAHRLLDELGLELGEEGLGELRREREGAERRTHLPTTHG
eukprot:3508862-Prymnesium_polylepis.1